MPSNPKPAKSNRPEKPESSRPATVVRADGATVCGECHMENRHHRKCSRYGMVRPRKTAAERWRALPEGARRSALSDLDARIHYWDVSVDDARTTLDATVARLRKRGLRALLALAKEARHAR